MSSKSHKDAPENHPLQVIDTLLSRPSAAESRVAAMPAVERCVQALERRAPEVVDSARRVGVEIEYLGVNPLFGEPRFYEGGDTDWVLGPAIADKDTVVPRREGRELQRLHDADIEFPMIYVAHEVPKDRTELARAEAATGKRALDKEEAAELVGPVPPPAEAVEKGERFAQQTTRVMSAIGRAAPVVGGLALGAIAAPVLLVGAALANLDPVIIGAVPAVGGRPGEPAAWYVLAKWDW